jgi:hypothetical protein
LATATFFAWSKKVAERKSSEIETCLSKDDISYSILQH